MKTLLKYGLLIAGGAMVWVVAVHYLVTNPASMVHQPGTPIFFNVLQFAMIYLGIKAVERERGDRLTFKEGIQTGFGISLIYGIALSVFFAIVLAVIGTKWMAIEPGAGSTPSSQIALAFVGLFMFTLIFGLIYSTVISFFIAKRQSDQ
ncbi:MAG TPA: DUF4199 family protein [Pyrinomonadaceae bacterium]|nr:DUF4199 family protein [Pyrinomonadaceae bacterium]